MCWNIRCVRIIDTYFWPLIAKTLEVVFVFKKKIYLLIEICFLLFTPHDQHEPYLRGVSVGLRCGVFVAQWDSRWAPTGLSSPVAGGRWDPGCPPSARDCPGWWDSPLLAPSSSRLPEDLQPERMSLQKKKEKFYSMISRISKIRHWYLYFSDGQNEEFVLLQVCVYTSQSLTYHVSLCHRNPLSCCCKHTLLH